MKLSIRRFQLSVLLMMNRRLTPTCEGLDFSFRRAKDLKFWVAFGTPAYSRVGRQKVKLSSRSSLVAREILTPQGQPTRSSHPWCIESFSEYLGSRAIHKSLRSPDTRDRFPSTTSGTSLGSSRLTNWSAVLEISV